VYRHNARLLEGGGALATNGGMNFYLNFSKVTSIHHKGLFFQPLPNLIRYTQPEFTDHPFYEQKYFYQRGLENLREHPGRLLFAFTNFREAFLFGGQGYWPGWHMSFSFALVNWPFILVFWVPALVHAISFVGSRAIFRSPDPVRPLLLSLLFASFVTIYAFLGDPRMRVPFDVVAVVLALHALADWLRARSDPGSPSSSRVDITRVGTMCR
jgi:hypothetical protein